MKPAVVRFYFDADILGLGRLLASLRADCTYPGDSGSVIHRRERPPCLVTTPDIPDQDWIPLVADAGYLIVTRDRLISRRVAERQAVVQHRARMVVLAARDAQTVWAQLEVVMSQWRRIESLLGRPGPFIVRTSRTTLSDVDV
ncbi:MAG: hypothetical protein OXH20_01870 [bacterium]|nr:hypothetical protein [bacterium]MDE0667505.1 hypothetical protein [bacterium]